tara:strand:- start:420 stop:596 length:177 start_codon:yes stop_codon:yes gene_type:complete
MTQLHAREKPAPKRDRHGNIILEAPPREAPLVEEKPEVKLEVKVPAKKKAAKKSKGKK